MHKPAASLNSDAQTLGQILERDISSQPTFASAQPYCAHPREVLLERLGVGPGRVVIGGAIILG